MTKHDEHTKAIGLITIRSVIEKLRCNITAVKDRNTGQVHTMLEAREKGILDLRNNQYVDSSTKGTMTLDEAIERELVVVNFESDDNKPEIVTKSFAVNFVVDQKKKEKVPFYEAVQRGLINAETGEYLNNKTGEKVQAGKAIRTGFLKGREIQDTRGLDIEAEDKNVKERIRTIRQSVVKSLAVLAALRKAAKKPSHK